MGEIEQEPPNKKRRLNGNKSNNHNNKDEGKNEENDDEDDDIEILSGNEIKASSILLQSASPVFNNILSNDMREKQEKTIKVHAKTVKDVDDMIYFMATNQLRQDSNAM